MKYKNSSKRLFEGIKPNYGKKNKEIEQYILKKILNNDQPDQRSKIRAGYTYLGQMIAHDIVPNNHSFKRIISPSLNLDSLYGHNDCLHDYMFDDYGRFQMTQSKCPKSKQMINSDLLRTSNHNAIIPELRNDLNHIISQFHLFWQKLHNKILSIVYKKQISNKKNIRAVSVNDIRDYVRVIFHKVVINDYLKNILHPDIYQLYCKKNNSFLYHKKRKLKHIPLEFSHACFRFGHSMVREKYGLNRFKVAVYLADLFKDNVNKPVSVKNMIDWRLFFKSRAVKVSKYGQAGVQRAQLINTNIEDVMGKVPMNDKNLHDIRALNIRANLEANLPTGQQVFTELQRFSSLHEIFKKEAKLYKKINKRNNRMPLWPYVLLEAELRQKSLNNPSVKEDGLGVLGSIIVAEVIMVSIRSVESIKYSKMIDINNFIKTTILSKKQKRLKMMDVIDFNQ